MLKCDEKYISLAVDRFDNGEPMKVAILAGGRGTRLADPADTHGIVPKPMIRIGEQPILWHILKHYEKFGFSETGKVTHWGEIDLIEMKKGLLLK